MNHVVEEAFVRQGGCACGCAGQGPHSIRNRHSIMLKHGEMQVTAPKPVWLAWTPTGPRVEPRSLHVHERGQRT
jgi:hypothetical protein